MGDLLAQVRGGQSAVMVIRGEPGVGKTALLSRLVAEASGFRVVHILGVESEMELPFAGLHELSRPMLAYVSSLPEPQRDALSMALGMKAGDSPDRFAVALGVLALLSDAAEEQPLLCVVDDAHWLDQASAQVLGFVARRLLAEPIALVFAARTSVATPDHLAGLPELHVGGLDEASAGAVLATVISGPLDEKVRARIIEETHGNPLALIELCRGLTPAEVAGGFAMPTTGDLPRRIEEQYLGRLGELPRHAQQLVLLAAAEPLGDAAVLLRAAQAIDLGPSSVRLAVASGLLEISANVRFCHPLARSAVYRAAADEDRRAAHEALASETDPGTDADRRAWHRAHATAGPDEAVAEQLISSASRAVQRGGVAAAAAFWERAVALTPDPGQRALRALAAAEVKYAAGDFEAVQSLLVQAEVGPPDELRDGQVQRMRARVAFALRRGSDAPPLLLRAAQRLEALDPEMACQTYLEALVAAIYAGRLCQGNSVEMIARAAKSAASRPELNQTQRLVKGLATRLTNGYVDAAPLLKVGLHDFLAQPKELGWDYVSYNMIAMDLWDDQTWSDLAAGQVQLARASGTFSWLPFALDYLAEFHIQCGKLDLADALFTESERIDPGARTTTLPYVPLMLAAWRGDAARTVGLSETMSRGASARGEGGAMTYTEYATAVLRNGLGDYQRASEAASRASRVDELVISPWALYELVEAAARSDQHSGASAAAEQLSAIATASGTNWAKGAAARSRALVAEGAAAEDLYREAVELLSGTLMAAHLARAQLVYGEWLRRGNRRTDARAQLRPAFEAFSSIGAHGFGQRARRELLATGEKVAKRDGVSWDKLTPQEEQIAQLASQGKTNPEIGLQLFLGGRTIEWHLRKVFTKLDISSRRELSEALKRRRK